MLKKPNAKKRTSETPAAYQKPEIDKMREDSTINANGSINLTTAEIIDFSEGADSQP